MKTHVTEAEIRKLVREELTKGEVRGIVDDKLDSFLKDKDLNKKIRSVTADVLAEFFREMWRKDGFWKNSLKNG